jgi:ribosome biogenesis protein ERB1
MRVKVSKMVHAIKMGWMKPRPVRSAEEEEKKRFYMLWQTDDQVEENMRRVHDPIPAPKMR